MTGRLVINLHEEDERTCVQTEAHISHVTGEADLYVILNAVCKALQLSPFNVMVFATGYLTDLFSAENVSETILSKDLMEKLKEMGYNPNES